METIPDILLHDGNLVKRRISIYYYIIIEHVWIMPTNPSTSLRSWKRWGLSMLLLILIRGRSELLEYMSWIRMEERSSVTLQIMVQIVLPEANWYQSGVSQIFACCSRSDVFLLAELASTELNVNHTLMGMMLVILCKAVAVCEHQYLHTLQQWWPNAGEHRREKHMIQSIMTWR